MIIVRYADDFVLGLVRFVAVVALGKIGPSAKDGLPALKEASKSPRVVADAALEAIRIIESDN